MKFKVNMPYTMYNDVIINKGQLIKFKPIKYNNFKHL